VAHNSLACGFTHYELRNEPLGDPGVKFLSSPLEIAVRFGFEFDDEARPANVALPESVRRRAASTPQNECQDHEVLARTPRSCRLQNAKSRRARKSRVCNFDDLSGARWAETFDMVMSVDGGGCFWEKCTTLVEAYK